MYAPIFNRVADKYRDQVEVYDINVDNDPETAQKYEVRSIPFTVLAKEDGSAVKKAGVLSEKELEELFLS
jgi:thioredoxin 1